MKIIAAYLLAVLGGNKNPNATDITKILASVGIEGDKERIDKLIAELDGKDIDQVIAKGVEKLQSGFTNTTTSVPHVDNQQPPQPPSPTGSTGSGSSGDFGNMFDLFG